MTYPTAPEQSYSYTAFQQSQGGNDFPGTRLDEDLAKLYASQAEIIEFIKNVQRADGKLNNGIVTEEALGSGIALGLEAPTPWATATDYEIGQTVTTAAKLYYCLVGHTSSVFATELAAGKWTLMADFNIDSEVGVDGVVTASITDGAVTEPKLADAAVSTAKLADSSVTRAKAAVDFGAIPIGAKMSYAGVSLPAGWLWASGDAVSRTTYSALFAALTLVMNVSGSIGSTSLTIPAGCDHLGLSGAVLEGSGLTAGTTIASISGTVATLSTPIIGAVSSVRALPHGAGDGLTTFNLPDHRGRAGIGRDDLGGSVASRVSAPVIPNAGLGLGKAGGSATHSLSEAEGPIHAHTVNDGGHSHSKTDPGHAHQYDKFSTGGSGAGMSGGSGGSYTTPGTAAAFTDITINSATTGITLQNSGSGAAHNNMQPSLVENVIVFAGV